MSYDLGKVVGSTGKGIASISKTGTSGLVDTYTIVFTDGTSTTFNVTNGAGAVVTSWESTLSDTKVASEKLVKNALDSKAESNHAHDSRYYTQTEIDTALAGKQATLVSGTNIKTINNNSILGSGNIHISGGGGGDVDIVTSWEETLSDEKVPSEKLTKNTIDTKVTGTKVTSWSGTVSDSNIPSEKLVKDSLDAKASSSHTHASTVITDDNSDYSYIHTGLPTSPNYVHDTFMDIDSVIGDLQDLIGDAITYINQ